MAPSPITAMTLFLSPLRSRATAMPRPAEIEVEECAAPNGSYSLSARLVKPDKPAALADGADAVAPAGENLVRISLVADVPDQPVGRRVEDMVQRDGQFDHAEPGAEMAAGLGDRVDGLGAQFIGQLLSCSADRFFMSLGCRTRSSNGVLEASGKSNSTRFYDQWAEAGLRSR